MGRSPAFCKAEEVTDVQEAPEVPGPPEIVGSARTCWNVGFDIIYDPSAPHEYKYGIKAQDPQNACYDKLRSFRSYSDAEAYVTSNAPHGGQCPSAEQLEEHELVSGQPDREGWTKLGVKVDGSGKDWYAYRKPMYYMLVDPEGKEEDKKFFGPSASTGMHQWLRAQGSSVTNDGGQRSQVHQNYMGLRVH